MIVPSGAWRCDCRTAAGADGHRSRRGRSTMHPSLPALLPQHRSEPSTLRCIARRKLTHTPQRFNRHATLASQLPVLNVTVLRRIASNRNAAACLPRDFTVTLMFESRKLHQLQLSQTAAHRHLTAGASLRVPLRV